MRKRAIQPEDKEQRRQAILDAAHGLWLTQPDRVANVAEVADAAGLAKGTVYLYFSSKGRLMLALLDRMVDGFFDALSERCAAGPLNLDELLEVTRRHLVEVPGYLPLASLALGLTERQLPPTVVSQFQLRMARRLERGAEALLCHLPLARPPRPRSCSTPAMP